MTDNEQNQLIPLLNKYTEAREVYKKLSKDSGNNLNQQLSNNIQETSKKLDESFAELIAARPSSLVEIYSKADVLINEVLSESEVTSYHQQALLSVLEDLKSLLG